MPGGARTRSYQWLFANWPLKLTSVALAAIIWAAVAASQPGTRRLPVTLRVRAPEGRPLAAAAPEVYGVFTGPARELLKLYASPPVITVEVPDTVMDSVYSVPLAPRSIEIPPHVNVHADSIQPASVTLSLAAGESRSPDHARVSPENGPVSERVLMGIPVTVRGDRGGAWSSQPPAVIVTVRGTSNRIARLTRDSLEVAAEPDGTGRPETVRLRVAAPAGVEATATPDTAVVQRRLRG